MKDGVLPTPFDAREVDDSESRVRFSTSEIIQTTVAVTENIIKSQQKSSLRGKSGISNQNPTLYPILDSEHDPLDLVLVTETQQLDPGIGDEFSKSYKAEDIGHQSKILNSLEQIDAAVQNNLVCLQNSQLEPTKVLRIQAGLRFINLIENTQEVLV